MTDLHLIYWLGLSTVSYIIREVAQVIWLRWKDDCFPPLNEELFKKTADGFEERTQFPHCVGAIDGKHTG